MSSRRLAWRWLETSAQAGPVRWVTVGDVVGNGGLCGQRAGIVGVVDHEFLAGADLGLDALQVAGVGRGRDELDLVFAGVGADVGRPVGRQVVLDPVDPLAGGVARRIICVNAGTARPARRGRMRG